MSTTVVPAPATQAQRLDRSEKLAEQTEKQQAAQNEEVLAEDDANVEAVSEEVADAKAEATGEKETAVSETSLAGSFEFEGALADAAATLTVEAREADESGYAQEGGSSSIVLLVAAVALVGLGVAALASGSSDGDSPDVPTNEDPTFGAAPTVSTEEDAPVTFTVSATDPDGDALTYSATATNGTASVGTGGSITFTPTADFNGSATVTVTASDGNGGSATQTITVTVTPVADAPTGEASIAVTTDEDTELSGAVAITDADGDDLTYAIASAASNGVVVLAEDGTFTYTPGANFNGTDSFSVTGSDGTSSFTQTVNVTVTAVNDAPAFGAEEATVEMSNQETFSNTLVATDVDGDDLTFSLTTAAANGTAVVEADGSITYTADAGFVGTDTIVVTVSDGELTDTATINFVVSDGPPNNAPEFGVDAVDITVEQDGTFGGTLAATDADDDDLAYSLTTDATNGTAVVNADGSYTYTPDAGYVGADSYVVAVSDGRGGTDSLTVNVTVEEAAQVEDLALDNGAASLLAFLGLSEAAADGSIVTLDSGQAYNLTEDADSRTDLVLRNFNSDDVIESNASLTLYSFGTAGSAGEDLRITLNAGGNFTNLIIDDALVGYDGFIFDYNDAVDALGFDFMTFA